MTRRKRRNHTASFKAKVAPAALRDGRSTEAELTTLKLIVGPGDDGEPVMTTLLPNED